MLFERQKNYLKNPIVLIMLMIYNILQKNDCPDLTLYTKNVLKYLHNLFKV